MMFKISIEYTSVSREKSGAKCNSVVRTICTENPEKTQNMTAECAFKLILRLTSPGHASTVSRAMYKTRDVVSLTQLIQIYMS